MSMAKHIQSSCRRYATAIIAVFVIFLAGCQPQGGQFLTRGIGTGLAASDSGQAGTNQLIYYNYLCNQAGIGIGSENCLQSVSGSSEWTLLTYQGMNDIDRRCDAYLEWLDNKKRSKGPVLNQLGSVRNAATQIIEITSSGASALRAISIVSQAFDLITQSIDNYHTRLLLEIDQRTINTIVLQARHKFRQDFRKQSVRNKPESEYVLRTYLRICLPFAIESVINGNATLVALGASPDLAKEASIHQSPVLATVVKPIIPNQKFGSGRRKATRIKPGKDFGKVFEDSTIFGQRDLEILQKAMCLQGQGIGGIGPKTAASIAIFEDTIFDSVRFPALSPNKNGLISRSEFDGITGLDDCDSSIARNMFERTLYELPPTDEINRNREELILLINARLGTSLNTGLTLGDPALRSQIASARNAYGASSYNGFANDHVTQQLINFLRRGSPPQTN